MNLDPSAKHDVAEAADVGQGGCLNAVRCEDGHVAG